MNWFDLTAEEIGELYRNRWKIETFFRWVKQHLKLMRFYGEGDQNNNGSLLPFDASNPLLHKVFFL
jgi:hypothetical protein